MDLILYNNKSIFLGGHHLTMKVKAIDNSGYSSAHGKVDQVLK